MFGRRSSGCETAYDLVRDIFSAAATACALWALHRLARGALLKARVEALEDVAEDLQPEERAVIVSRVARDAMRF